METKTINYRDFKNNSRMVFVLYKRKKNIEILSKKKTSNEFFHDFKI